MKCLLCHNDTRMVIASELRHGERSKVYYCRKCHLAMLGSKISLPQLKRFYRKDYRKKFRPNLSKESNPQELFEVYKNFQEGRLSLIRRYLGKDKRLLEIGCSAGMFLYQVKKHVKETVGIDYDSKSVAFATEKCSCAIFDRDIEET